MSINHLAWNDLQYGKVALCGRADWDRLLERDHDPDTARQRALGRRETGGP